MWWKFHCALIQILIKWLLQYLAHGMTAGLSWHVPNFVVIWSPVIELELNEISIEYELWWKNHITTNFCTWLDSTAVVPCAKFCSDFFVWIWMSAKWNFHLISIVMEKSFINWFFGLSELSWQLFVWANYQYAWTRLVPMFDNAWKQKGGR